MTDPDTIAAFHAIQREIDSKKPTPLEEAVLRHVDGEAQPLPAIPNHLTLPPTDGEIFDNVPVALPEEITEKVERKNLDDDNWDENEVTAVREVPNIIRKPFDPTGCMM